MWMHPVCALIVTLFIGLLQGAEAAYLRCYKGSINNYISAPLENPRLILGSSCLDRSLPTIVYTFGYRGRSAGPATTAVLKAYIAKRKRNVMLLDWEEEAKSGYLGIPLGYVLNAVPNAAKVGQELGSTLSHLASAGLNRTHLVGHSLGAHLMAYAGRSSREKGYTVARITGLDPARALFEGTLTVRSGLDRTCARFVDIIHSDPGGYGTSQPAGTVDFWPNYAGTSASQPGCPAGDFDMFSPEDLCSHDRSWKYFVEAIANPTAFPASSAADFDSWAARSPRAASAIFLGDLTDNRAQGNFFLVTNSSAPFGMGSEGLKPDANQIRRRRSNNSLTRFLKYLR